MASVATTAAVFARESAPASRAARHAVPAAAPTPCAATHSAIAEDQS